MAHCGECGYCSNPHDIITYVETRKTIAKSAKKCGPNTFLGSYDDLADCLEEKIRFRRECTYCLADNMENTAKECLSTCMRTLFSGFMTDNNVPGAGDQGWMNQCLFCNEKCPGRPLSRAVVLHVAAWALFRKLNATRKSNVHGLTLIGLLSTLQKLDSKKIATRFSELVLGRAGVE